MKMSIQQKRKGLEEGEKNDNFRDNAMFAIASQNTLTICGIYVCCALECVSMHACMDIMDFESQL